MSYKRKAGGMKLTSSVERTASYLQSAGEERQRATLPAVLRAAWTPPSRQLRTDYEGGQMGREGGVWTHHYLDVTP